VAVDNWDGRRLSPRLKQFEAPLWEIKATCLGQRLSDFQNETKTETESQTGA